jgi:hypothetical protein
VQKETWIASVHNGKAVPQLDTYSLDCRGRLVRGPVLKIHSRLESRHLNCANRVSHRHISLMKTITPDIGSNCGVRKKGFFVGVDASEIAAMSADKERKWWG